MTFHLRIGKPSCIAGLSLSHRVSSDSSQECASGRVDADVHDVLLSNELDRSLQMTRHVSTLYGSRNGGFVGLETLAGSGAQAGMEWAGESRKHRAVNVRILEALKLSTCRGWLGMVASPAKKVNYSGCLLRLLQLNNFPADNALSDTPIQGLDTPRSKHKGDHVAQQQGNNVDIPRHRD